MKTRDVSSGEVSSLSSDDEELSAKVMRQSSPSPVRPSKGARNRIWQSVVLENTLEKAFKSTALELSEPAIIDRGAESYCFEESELAVGSIASMDRHLPSDRKRRLSERLAPRSYDKTIPRVHYGVDFDSPPDEVILAIARFLQERREDLIKQIVENIGVRRALEFCYLTEDIEKYGGLCTRDGTRRRTRGGVFFFLIRCSDQVSKDEKKLIFTELPDGKLSRKRARKARRRRRRAAPMQEQKCSSNCEANVDFKDLPSPNVYIE
ncbi:unnamed protein product [Hydatigera taeniaeformis]|uniref:Phosphorylated adapter RNA export protein n=1 Tax=Hydatigena taeniaeformis TaxID=6205 RepID=A0A0R3X5J4_HYDTA|nr:unnamed protein product [Hydatigera taeniaeformis]